jgi:hypothetical protein
MMKKYTNLSKIVLGFVLFLAGCSLPASSQSIPTTVQISATLKFTPTVTTLLIVEPTETATLLPTKTPTQTAFPTRTASPTITLTITPRPTLSTNQAQALILELLKTNGGCKLPCWWGITPGKTSWIDANEFLRTFASKTIPFTIFQQTFYEVVFDNLPKSVSSGSVGAVIAVRDETVESVAVDIYYPLTEILSIYGQPDEVWVYVEGFTLIGHKPFFVISLFYASQGILAVYEGSAEAEKVVQVCPYRIPSAEHRWYLWNPKQKITFKVAGTHIPLEGKDYRLLEDATGMNEQTFYEIYKDPANTHQCFGVEDPNYP